MPYYKYLIIGGGMAADAAVRGIREVDANGAIGLISAEPDPPYDRPPLSKGLWQGKPLEKIWRGTADRDIALHLGRDAHKLELHSKGVIDGDGTMYTFDKLLLATGGSPRKLPLDNESIIYFRTLEDYRQLRALTENRQRFGVIGGGFIGSEIAAALAMNKKGVVMIFPEETVGSRAFPQDLGLFLNDFYRDKGVQLITGETLVGVETRGAEFLLKTRSGQEHPVGGLVAGIGIQPNIALAQAAGLEVDNGIAVDKFLRTSHPDVYAAGDVASFHNSALAKRMRVEHEDNANTMGRLAGRNMVGESAPYDYLPFFYSDLFELGYEAVGELDSRLETVSDWQDPYRKGVVYYLQDGRVRGVLLWNVWEQIEAARRLIAEPGPFAPADLKGALPA